MAENKREPTEKTPTGFEVRIPKRREFFGNLRKIAGRTTPQWKDAVDEQAKGSATDDPKK